jgi:transmembrane sensor
MEKYRKYHIEDFVQDLYFRKWVLGKLPKENLHWENWLNKNPEKQTLIDEAKSLVIASQVEEIETNSVEIQQGIDAVLFRTQPKTKKLYQQTWLRIAASVILIASFVLFLYKSETLTQNYRKNILTKATETENNSTQSMSLKLSDGSIVTLKKGSKLQVADDFGVQNRSVFLTGEAFFEVTKDPQRPFLVYAGGIVTKVLGTSFNVRAYNNETKTLVAVRTGRVTVYQEEKTNFRNQVHPEQILLTPNQQVVFEKKVEKLVKTLVEKPVILLPNTQSNTFDYDETPIPEVLNQLEKAYGVKIVFDADLLANCNLTATFGNEPLFDKMSIICETIQARYEIADGQIVIYAKGCR